jgi:hypothetical protein
LNTEDAPTTKASKSVNDVIVMATALFCIIKIILSLMDTLDSGGASAIPDIRMNISSIPIPAKIEDERNIGSFILNLLCGRL